MGIGSTVLEFPVMATGEVDGTVRLKKAGAEVEVSRVRMQLVNPEGEVVQEQKTAFDGFYLFTFVPPGEYRLRVSPEQVERLGLKTPPEETVKIEGLGNVVSGIDFTLEIKPKPPGGTNSHKSPPRNIPAPETGPQEAPVPEAPPLTIPRPRRTISLR